MYGNCSYLAASKKTFLSNSSFPPTPTSKSEGGERTCDALNCRYPGVYRRRSPLTSGDPFASLCQLHKAHQTIPTVVDISNK